MQRSYMEDDLDKIGEFLKKLIETKEGTIRFSKLKDVQNKAWYILDVDAKDDEEEDED